MSHGWPEVRTRWPKRPVDIKCIDDAGCLYDFGHIPPVLFARKLWEYGCERPDPSKIRHEYWRLKYDLFEEYAYIVSPVRKGAPFAIPVTCYGGDIA